MNRPNRLKGIKVVEERLGTGEIAERGDRVTYRLTGYLNQGDRIVDSEESQTTLGKRRVIAGLEYSLEGMKEGGYRKVRISPHLAYRDQGIEGLIPPNAALIYELTLLTVQKGPSG